MRQRARMVAAAGIGAAFMIGAAGLAPASAQSLPIIPPIGIGVSGCALAGNLSPCIAAAGAIPPVIIVSGSGGDRNAHVEKDVDHYRGEARVVVGE